MGSNGKDQKVKGVCGIAAIMGYQLRQVGTPVQVHAVADVARTAVPDVVLESAAGDQTAIERHSG